MRMYECNGGVFATEAEAVRYAASNTYQVCGDSETRIAPMVREVEFMSYDRNPDEAFAEAWQASRNQPMSELPRR